jgi:hypothetical protein
MEKEEYKNIKTIRFPNTVEDEKQGVYGATMDEWKFEYVSENGEMAEIAWIAVFKNGKKIAQIKQSVCDIYFI